AMKSLAPAAEGAPAADIVTVVSGIGYGKKNPFPSEVLANGLLNGEGSAKETAHVEFSLEGAAMGHEPGDALAVVPTNCLPMVGEVLRAAKLKGTEEIEVKGVGKKPLVDALREDLDITALSKAVLKKLADASGSEALGKLLADDSKEQLLAYIQGREIVDALADFAPNGLSAEALAGIFRKL